VGQLDGYSLLEVARTVEREGWPLSRTSGSHLIYVHDSKRGSSRFPVTTRSARGC
jgi:predicted RNA binding protein YcfA (HicA-like mRNA interferase family)